MGAAAAPHTNITDTYAHDENRKIEFFNKCLSNLPQDTRDTLCHLFNLFALLTHFQPQTKLSPKLLAYTCGPWLLL